MTPTQLDSVFHQLAEHLHKGHMARLGISPTMHLAQCYNECKFGEEKSWRDTLYRTEFSRLLDANGGLTRRPIEIHDGWAVDTSLSLPHLDRMLADSDKIIAERRGVRLSKEGAYRSYFQNIFQLEDAVKYPSFLDFATSSDVVSVVGEYLETIPALSTTLPPGIRLVESNRAFDDRPDEPKDSQLYHIDYYSLPNMYVLVLLADTTIDHGPWTFLPRAASQRVRDKLGYWGPGSGYRIPDEQVYASVDPTEVITFTYPRGTVLFIESSGCLHYGSRNSIKPRFQLMLGYTGVCRTDFSEVIMPNNAYRARDTDSLLRKMVVNKYLKPPTPSQLLDAEKLSALCAELKQIAEDAGIKIDFCSGNSTCS